MSTRWEALCPPCDQEGPSCGKHCRFDGVADEVIVAKELKLFGTFRFDGEFQLAVDLMSRIPPAGTALFDLKLLSSLRSR